MALTINGITPKAITVNATAAQKLQLNGTTVWPPAWSYAQSAPGLYTITIPYTTKYAISVYGAAGGSYGSYPGGLAGYAYGQISLTAGTVIYACVGGCGTYYGSGDHDGGYNGGGRSFGGNYGNTTGGGCTHVAYLSGTLAQLGSGNLSKVIIVAGGGGGASDGGAGGAGGGLTGGNGNLGAMGGYTIGGTQYSGGGSGGSNTIYIEAGSFGAGGRSIVAYYAGSGGGGLYGGAGGQQSGSGAGGSGYLSNVLTNTAMQTGVRGGNGYFSIAAV